MVEELETTISPVKVKLSEVSTARVMELVPLVTVMPLPSVRVAAVGAAGSTTLMSDAQLLIANNALYLTPAVMALTLKYTGASAMPEPVTTTVAPAWIPTITMPTARSFVTTAVTKALPSGSIQARTPTGMYRIAVPSATAAGLGGPSAYLGAAPFCEVAPRSTAAPGVVLVSEKEFDKKTDDVPFWKKPSYWAIVGGVVAVLGGGAYWALKG